MLEKLETNCVIEIIEIESGEANKNIDTCLGVWNTLSDFNGDRKSLIINIGGGVITDLGGFVASTRITSYNVCYTKLLRQARL